MEKKNQIKVYIVLNKDIDVKFKCTKKSLESLLSRGKHFVLIEEFYELIEDEFYMQELNEGIRLPREPLAIEEVRRIYQQAKLENNNDAVLLVREVDRLQKELALLNNEVDSMKFEKLTLEEQLKNSRPSYKKMLRKYINDSDRKGFVYIIRTFDNHYKIGKTINLERRIPDLRIQLPYDEFEVILIIETNDKDELEKLLHKHFYLKRKNGEWFKLTEFDIDCLIAGEIPNSISQLYTVVSLHKR
ncbi:GIY-YIG nuclease family protein [Paenibacillus sp. NPDC058174]|uniref:GIY-YIG nuclease family protein n=1 Tax=Paenibacillus sp. NPDC058174 TaxID=3346366 RepID=UPI0036DB013A